MNVAVTGSTGLIGTALVSALEEDGHVVRRLVRRDVRDREREIRWDPAGGTIEADRLHGIDAAVHLAGENIAARRWNEEFKQRLRDSRVQGTRLLATSLAGLAEKPRVLVIATAVGYYGDRGEEPVDESSPPGKGFVADLCQQWEAAAEPAREAGIRVVLLRIGVVLSPRGGALAKMLPAFKMGVGGVIGSGRQYMSWITLADAVKAIRFAIENEALSGPVNAVAPEMVTNRQFTKALGRVLRRPTVLPMPAFAARLAFGEMADEMLLSGARVEPQILTKAGFAFEHPELEPALRSVLAR